MLWCAFLSRLHEPTGTGNKRVWSHIARSSVCHTVEFGTFVIELHGAGFRANVFETNVNKTHGKKGTCSTMSLPNCPKTRKLGLSTTEGNAGDRSAYRTRFRLAYL